MPGEKKYHTQAGLLSGVIQEQLYENGHLRSCMFEKQNKIAYHGEVYIPKYSDEDFRTRYRDAASFYERGELKALYLEKPQRVATPAGSLEAELVTFYPSGKMKRVFPVYGQISGFWSEEEEAERLPVCEIKAQGQIIKGKISCLAFYESGAVKSITLWPGESILVHTPVGEIRARFGLTFYENGSVKSVEPDQPVSINYASCGFYAYDNHPIGIHGESNSLVFNQEGTIRALKTTITTVILSGEGKEHCIMPENRISPTDIENTEVVPIHIEFNDSAVRISDSDGAVHVFTSEQYVMKTKQLPGNWYATQGCGACSGCNSCSKCTPI